MTPLQLPPVHTPGDAFLAVIAQQQAETNALLARLLDRLPEQAPAPGSEQGGKVELREPAVGDPSPSPSEPPARRTPSKRSTRKAG